jgi:uncharacterized protein with NRDE domain
MCLIVFCWQPGSATPLVVAANRDEYYARAAAPLAWWPGDRVLAGRDLRAGGSWMGVSRDGRFAALTNYRDPSRHRADAPSRGALVTDFLAGDGSGGEQIARLRDARIPYNDYNLLLYDGRQLLGYESRGDRTVRFGRGVHGVSNAAFDTPWPKVEALKAGLAGALDEDESLLGLLRDERMAPDGQLPHTGVPLELERGLSAAFIRLPGYGTHSSSVVRIGLGGITFSEWRYAQGEPDGLTRVEFPLS